MSIAHTIKSDPRLHLSIRLQKLPWLGPQHIGELPESQLIYAIILQAWEDSNKRFPTLSRQSAREWFFSKQFKEFCSTLELPGRFIQEQAIKIWR